jgi:hypothetical protein
MRGNEIFRCTDAAVPAGHRPHPAQNRNWRGRLQFVDVDKLAELKLIAEYEIMVLFGERNISGMG